MGACHAQYDVTCKGTIFTQSCLTILMMLYLLEMVLGTCSIATCLQSVGQPMPLGRGAVPILRLVQLLKPCQRLGSTNDYALHCPRAAPSVGVVACTYHHWFRPFSQHRRYCQLPVSGRRMQRFLQFRLGSHQLPIVLGCFAGGQHVARANRVCTHCVSVAVAEECT